MARTTAQALDIRLSKLSFVKKLALIDEIRDVLFGHELDALMEGAERPVQQRIPACPECGSMEARRFGKRRGLQRYQCRECGRHFQEERPRSVVESSHLPKSTWMKFIGCHVDNLTYKAAAERCGVSEKTAHFMGMRLMKVIAETSAAWTLEPGCRAQVDETYIHESFKGNRSKCAGFEMPRAPYARGRSTSDGEGRAQGRSKADWLCVVSGVDEARRCFFEISGRGSMDSRECAAALSGRLARGSRVVTDDLHSYVSALKDMGVRHIRCVAADHGPLNHVNSLHSHVKAFAKSKRAVSSRRLPLYLADFAWRWEALHNRTSEDARRDVARRVASFDFAGAAQAIKAAAYPFLEWWTGSGGARENERREIARMQRGIDRARAEAAGDAAAEQAVEERQAELDARAKAAGVRLKGAKARERGRKAKPNMTLLMLKAQGAS